MRKLFRSNSRSRGSSHGMAASVTSTSEIVVLRGSRMSVSVSGRAPGQAVCGPTTATKLVFVVPAGLRPLGQAYAAGIRSASVRLFGPSQGSSKR